MLMKFPTVMEYLSDAGLLDSGDRQAIDAAKKKRRKEYLLMKKREHRKANTSITLTFPNKEMRRIELEASAHRMKTPAYLRECINSAREQAYIVPNEEEVQQIELLLRNIGNHTNQITRLAHRMTLEPDEALKAIQGHVQHCENVLTAMFRKPRNLEHCIRQELNKNPAFMTVIFRIMQCHVKSLSNADQDPPAQIQ